MQAFNHFSKAARRPFPLTAALCAVISLFTPAVSGAEDKAALDPKADEWLKRMGDFLGQAKFFSFSAEVWQDSQLSSGQHIQAGRSVEVQARRPDRLRAQVDSTRHHRELIYDGAAITLFNRAQNFYGSIRASGSLDEAMDTACERFGITLPLEDLLRANPHKDLLEKVTSGSDIGAVTVLGTPCEHLAFSQEDIDWQIWIENGARPVPRKFVITYKDEPDSPQYTAIFSKWDLSTPLPDFVFKFEPPPEASKIKVREMRALNQSGKKEDK